MKIDIQIDENCKEPKIIILASKIDDEIKEIISQLSNNQSKMIPGFRDNKVTMLESHNIYRIFATNGKVIAQTQHDEYILRMRLYEALACLDSQSFVRISNSEIINLKKVKNFDLSFTGTICVTLTNNSITYVSRRYVSKIKQILGMRGNKV